MSIIETIVLAIVEGLTEFLPISSTGHMIIASSLMGIASDPFTKMFTVAIQLGAILSVIVLYWKRFFQSLDFYYKLVVAFIPAAVAGLLFSDYIDAMLERVDVVGYTLLIGGVFFLFVDQIFSKNESSEKQVDYKTGFKIGAIQILSMMPGVSRSAATIIGGLSQGLSKKTAAEFSFFLAVPTMFGATAKKILDYFQDGNSFSSQQITMLAIGNLVAFIVAMIAIKSFITFLTKHGFKIFGYYRIIVGAAILILYYFGVKMEIV